MIHDLIPHHGDRQAKGVHLMNKIVCRLADVIVLCNQKYMTKVTEIYNVPQNKVRVVICGDDFQNTQSQATQSTHCFSDE